ncbi:hypothetical protein CHS0354_037967 [Potamilus streckersoni]|uniref:NAD(P)H oxidase (H2O2-forming) n=1 Tax=Potamilus streckersoni TaxID=2493646 RepID=A0AAE0T9M9_9BIVA|nr:hypothetical protein CHS0354_037967 [Potamilus streckersoni]
MDSQRPGCPIEYFNIPVPASDPVFRQEGNKHAEMPFRRTRYDLNSGHSPNNPRKQLSEITPFLDGQLIYGPNKAWTDAIREFRGGRLRGTNPNEVMMDFPADNSIKLPFENPPPPRDHVLKPVSRFYTLGNPRGHENPMLLTLGIVWFRWHNHQARSVLREHPSWDPVADDEKIFLIARKRVIAQYQKIAFYDWLPTWLSVNVNQQTENFWQSYPYKGYDSTLIPSISHEFQAAAMRFGHTLIPAGIWRRDGDCNYIRYELPGEFRQVSAIRLCNTFWNSRDFVEADMTSILRGMASTIAEREDSLLVPDISESVFGPLEFSRRDLAALNIQRGRDHGIADYNTVRIAYGLKEKKSWEAINPSYNKEEIKRLKTLYGNTTRPDDVDLFTGGLLETTPDGPGELFRTILLEQFLRIRNSDRFWFENKQTSKLTDSEMYDINTTTLYDIITSVTLVQLGDVQRDVFLFRSSDRVNCNEQPKQLDPEKSYKGIPIFESCTSLQTYDFFSGSEGAFALTYFFITLFILVTFGVMILLTRRRQKVKYMALKNAAYKHVKISDLTKFSVIEWVNPDEPVRFRVVQLDQKEMRINMYDQSGALVRLINVKAMAGSGVDRVEVHYSSDQNEDLIAVKIPSEYDLVLRFETHDERSRFSNLMDQLFLAISIATQSRSLVENYILRNCKTKKMRQEQLDKFFRIIFMQTLEDVSTNTIDENEFGYANLPQTCLTITEFAEVFGMKPDSLFVQQMFLLADADRSGLVSFREFMNVFLLLSSDDVDQRVQFLFNMYQKEGKLKLDDVHQMTRSLLELSDSNVNDRKVSEFVASVYEIAGIKHGDQLTLENFKKVFRYDEYRKTVERTSLALEDTGLGLPTVRPYQKSHKLAAKQSTFVRAYSIGRYRRPTLRRQISATAHDTILHTTTGTVHIAELKHPRSAAEEKLLKVVRFLETYRLQVFWMTIYSLVLCGLFLIRVYYFSVQSEHTGIRGIAGYGIACTRAAATAMSFTYSTLLLTMCRNSITRLRETFLNILIPFDSLHSMHKVSAFLALFFTGVHSIGHAFNFYHISTQPTSDIFCFFKEYFLPTHELASFQFWLFKTVTGLSGLILCSLVIVMYVFALPYARRYLFDAFWRTHKLYIIIYGLILVHGSRQMVEEMSFHCFLLGPLTWYILDSLVSISRMKIHLRVLKAEILPSDVIALTIKKPPGFQHKSGQWVRMSCEALGKHEFHPFTLSSAPHERCLSLHIRAVGPWTKNIRETFDPNRNTSYPKIYLDGPFGEGHQDWYRYDLSVLIGGGIGVTPFASILKDIVHKSAMNVPFACKKIYFLWVTRTQKQFEWMTDIIREVEDRDSKDLVEVHIFVTQFKKKYDLRTSMLYLCERHFQKVADKSIFTGLRATTHFGRPRFQDFLASLSHEHRTVRRLGVFSCGPHPLTLAVEKACKELNKFESPTYYHRFENF